MTLDSNVYGIGRTHEPLLAAAVAIARPGPVLEVGAGNYSTPLLHALCAAMGRELLTIESDINWVERFASLRSSTHKLVHVIDWDAAIPLTDSRTWSVVFIDHAPALRRVVEIDRLADRAEFIVVHDSEDAAYNYGPSFEKFKHQHDYKRFTPWTTVLSNVRSFPEGV